MPSPEQLLSLTQARPLAYLTRAQTHAATFDKQRVMKLAIVVAIHAAVFWIAWNVVVESKPAPLIRVSLLAIDSPQQTVVAPAPKPVSQKTPIAKSTVTKPLDHSVEAAPIETQALLPAAELPTLAIAPAPTAMSTTTANATQSAPSSNPSPASLSVPTKPKIELPSSEADYLTNPAPPYPPISKRLKEQGRVLLRVYVSADGAAIQVELRQSSGFERLDNVAIETVKRWKFVTGKRDGVAEAMWVVVPISFELS